MLETSWTLSRTELEPSVDDDVAQVYLGKALSHFHCYMMCSRFIGNDCELSIFNAEQECFSPEKKDKTTTTTTTTKPASFRKPKLCVVNNNSVKKATSSSQFKNDANWAPSNAIDGKMSRQIFYSLKEKMAWLQFEFKLELTITRVRLTNRNDDVTLKNKAVAQQLANVFVRVGNEKAVKGKQMNGGDCGFYQGPSVHRGVHVISCQPPRKGKFLTLQNKDMGMNRYIQISEVEAFTVDCKSLTSVRECQIQKDYMITAKASSQYRGKSKTVKLSFVCLL